MSDDTLKTKTVVENTKNLNDFNWAIKENVDGLLIKKEQYIPDDFLDANKDDRFESTHTRAKEYHRFASIPVVVVEQWLKEGFDVYREPAKEIIKRLKQQNLQAFLTSNKSI
jgi:hypothetical protein